MKKNIKLKASDEKFSTLFRRGSALLHKGQVQEAVPLLEKAHTLKPDHLDAALNLSGAYILTKKFKKAAALLEALRDQAPNNAMIWTNLGAAYLGNPVLARDGEQLQAIAAFEKALSIDPIAPSVAYNIGLIYRDRREFDSAISWFKRAVQTNPKDKDALTLLAKLEDQVNQA